MELSIQDITKGSSVIVSSVLPGEQWQWAFGRHGKARGSSIYSGTHNA